MRLGITVVFAADIHAIHEAEKQMRVRPYTTIPYDLHVQGSALTVSFYHNYLTGRAFALWQLGCARLKAERQVEEHLKHVTEKVDELETAKKEVRKKLRLQSRRSVATFIIRDYAGGKWEGSNLKRGPKMCV